PGALGRANGGAVNLAHLASFRGRQVIERRRLRTGLEALREERVPAVFVDIPVVVLVLPQLGGCLAIPAGHEDLPVPPGREGAGAEAMIDEWRVLGVNRGKGGYADDLEDPAQPEETPVAPALHVEIFGRRLPPVRL